MLLYHVATEREFFIYYDKEGGKQAIILNHCDICDFSDWIVLQLW